MVAAYVVRLFIVIKFSKFQIKDILDSSLQSVKGDDAAMCDMACQTR